MKVFRIAGLLGILVAVCSGTVGTARADVVRCSFWCSGVRYSGYCYQSLQSCCDDLATDCPDGYVFQGGSCTDGLSYC